MIKSHIEDGSKRVKTDKILYIKKHPDWLPTQNLPQNTKEIIEIYDKNNSTHLLLDEHSEEFFKGYIDPENKICGKRIKHLPTGKPLARGGFSIFAKNLHINKEKKFEWDICFENESGLKTYLYSEDKIHIEKEKKAQIVDEFAKSYQTIIKKLKEDLIKTKQTKYLALYTLLKTLIRVGNLEYYHLDGHKGLTTLQKKDITINKNKVTFEFIGKDGIPQKIQKTFEDFYIQILINLLNKKKDEDFVFTNSKGIPLHSSTFSKILFKYTNKHFYPHIIRSYHADTKCKNFIQKHKTATKQEVNKQFDKIAKDLGHKKYNKKKKQWEVCHQVTTDSYIRPKYVEEMKNMYKKK
jgi:hypothetical protein